MTDTTTEIVPYETDGLTLNVRFDDREPWLTQKEMAALYRVSVKTVSEHLTTAFSEGELADSVIRSFRTTASDGKDYSTKHYNLDAILAVGYRVKSQKGTAFRQWATRRLRQDIMAASPATAELAQLGAALAQFGTVLATLADKVATLDAAVARLSTEPQSPADVIGLSGSRHISEQIKAYAAQMAVGYPDQKKAYRSWLKSGANELAGRLGYFGAGKSWRNLSFQDFARARPILEDMRRRAEKTSSSKQTRLTLAS